MKRESEPNQKEQINNLIAEKVLELLYGAGITNATRKEEADGLHFFFKVPLEHLETRKKQAASLGGHLDPTKFDKDNIIPFIKKFRLEYGEYLDLKFISRGVLSKTYEFVVSQRHFNPGNEK